MRKPGDAMCDADIQWLAPYHARAAKRVRLLIDFLAERFKGEPWKIKAAAQASAPRG